MGLYFILKHFHLYSAYKFKSYYAIIPLFKWWLYYSCVHFSIFIQSLNRQALYDFFILESSYILHSPKGVLQNSKIIRFQNHCLPTWSLNNRQNNIIHFILVFQKLYHVLYKNIQQFNRSFTLNYKDQNLLLLNYVNFNLEQV